MCNKGARRFRQVSNWQDMDQESRIHIRGVSDAYYIKHDVELGP